MEHAVPHAHQLVRLGQLDPKQYRSVSEYQTWAYSACSTAAMTEVMNYYGHRYRITDVLAVESSIGAITPQLGLVQEDGIARTVAHFGFQTDAGHDLTLDQIIGFANQGTPVIVGFPPQRYPGGHLLVVTGGTTPRSPSRTRPCGTSTRLLVPALCPIGRVLQPSSDRRKGVRHES